MLKSQYSTLRDVLPPLVFPSYDELMNIVPLSWPFIAYGIVCGFIGAKAAVSFCLDEISRNGTSDDNDIALLYASADENEMLELIKLRIPDNEQNVNGISLLWMYVLLWMCCQKLHEVDTLLEYVELIYAEFGYPKEIAPFVRYMPNCSMARDKNCLADALRDYMEKWRRTMDIQSDPPTPPGKNGPSYSHYHLNGGHEHLSPRNRNDPGFLR